MTPTVNARALTSICAAGLMLAGAVLGGQALAMGGNLATKGEALLNDQCAKCHAAGAEGDSKDAKAKPLRDIAVTLPADDTPAVLAAAIAKVHAEFKFEPMDVKAMVDYLEKLKLHVQKAKS
ncbi:MAG: c-type cytochrome [Hyphomicrobium sp.]